MLAEQRSMQTSTDLHLALHHCILRLPYGWARLLLAGVITCNVAAVTASRPALGKINHDIASVVVLQSYFRILLLSLWIAC
jgi:hypothetical protein